MMRASPHTRQGTPTLHVARGFWQRLGGLLVRRPLRADEALLLAPCNSVHTLFMRYAIDVAFVDRNGRVLKLVRDLAPWRAAGCLRAHAAVEMRAGAAERLGVRQGMTIAGGLPS